QDVKSSVLLDDLRDRAPAVVAGADIALMQRDLDAVIGMPGAEVRGEGLRLDHVAGVPGGDRRALAGEAPGDRGADAAGAAGDERDPAGELALGMLGHKGG